MALSTYLYKLKLTCFDFIFRQILASWCEQFVLNACDYLTISIIKTAESVTVDL